MPVHDHYIDAYQFEDLRGMIVPRSEDIELLARPGKDDTTARLTGVRGRPFAVVTMHYVADFEAAATAISEYVQLKDGNPYEVIQHSISFGFYRVLDVVEAVPPRAVASVVGSIIANPTVQQFCQWTLQHVPTP
jgi:hypothetical protein